jgi:hypothetical protein
VHRTGIKGFFYFEYLIMMISIKSPDNTIRKERKRGQATLLVIRTGFLPEIDNRFRFEYLLVFRWSKISDDVPGLPTLGSKRDRLRILDFEDPEG